MAATLGFISLSADAHTRAHKHFLLRPFRVKAGLTGGGDGDVRGPAGRAVADAGHAAVVGGGRRQPRHRQHVGGGGEGLLGLGGQRGLTLTYDPPVTLLSAPPTFSSLLAVHGLQSTW